MDWFNSAGMLLSVWKTALSSSQLDTVQDFVGHATIPESFGFNVAKGLLEEVAVVSLEHTLKGKMQ